MESSRFRFFFIVLSSLGLALGSAAPSAAEPSGEQRNVPHWVSSAPKVAHADESQRVKIVAFLSFRNQAALKNLIAAQSTPSSSRYGQYLTPDEFRAQFAPNAADVKRVQRTLQQLGFRVEFTPDSGLFVQASGTVSAVKTAFGVSQDLYAYKGKVLRANAETPRIPAGIADVVTYVAGLDEAALLRKPEHIRLNEEASASASASAGPNAPPPVPTTIPSPFCSTYWGDHSATLSTAAAPYPKTLPWLVCGYTPQQLRAAYGADGVRQDGTGVRVGIVDVYASPTIADDANRYSKNHGLPRLTNHNFQQIVPAGLYDVPANDPCGPQGWYEEESLDVEAVHSMAPGASIVFEGWLCTDPVNSPLYDLIDHHRVDIVTNSYSYGGDYGLSADFVTAENQFFLQAAAEGMSILFSSGDDGDLAAGNGVASGTWDATSPYVTAVGGTSLAVLDRDGDKREWGWGTYRAYLNAVTISADGKSVATSGPALPFAYYSGSGGGPSLIMPAPSYQSDVSYNLSAFTYLADGTRVTIDSLGIGAPVPARVTPDISMVGDPYTGFLYGETFTTAGNPVNDAGCTPISATTEYCEGSIGGTSLSSPLFAGVLAIVNQARFQNHKGAVGFVNPALYHLAHGDSESQSSPIIDVNKPASPTALLRGYLGSPSLLRIVTVNSAPNPNYTPGGDQPALIEGADTSLRTTRGYDNVTGLGTPNVPALIDAFTHF